MLIDVTRLIHRSLQGKLQTGVDRVSEAYVKHYAHQADAVVRVRGLWVQLGKGDSQLVFEAIIDRSPGFVRRLAWCVGRGVVLLSGSRYRRQLLINTGHSGLDHPQYSRELRRRHLTALYFLHDLIPITHPEYARPGEGQRHRLRLQTMFDTGEALVVNSCATRTALESYAQANGLHHPQCVVAPIAPTRLSAPSSRAPLTQPYFVMLGTIEPRKNHALLLQLWRALVEELGATAPRLVVIGQRGWECEHVVDLLERCPGLRHFVVEEPSCNDQALATWLHHAVALLFPSFAEGFGIPVLEALSLGVPVIASNLAVFQETVSDIPEYIDPLDGPGWRRAILDYMQTSSARRRLQLERMARYSPPTWTQHFAVVDVLLRPWLRKSGQLQPQAESGNAQPY